MSRVCAAKADELDAAVEHSLGQAQSPPRTGQGPPRAHEDIFVFTLGERYYWDAEAVRQENSSDTQRDHNLRYAKNYKAYDDRAAETGQPGNVNNAGIHQRGRVRRGGRCGMLSRRLPSLSWLTLCRLADQAGRGDDLHVDQRAGRLPDLWRCLAAGDRAGPAGATR